MHARASLMVALTLAAIAMTGAPGPIATVRPAAEPQVALANDNLAPAGHRVGDTLLLELTDTAAAWHILGDNNPAFTVAAFAEAGNAPTIPAPLVRVPAGTAIHLAIRNTFDDTLILRGFSERGPALDSLIVLPRSTAEGIFVRRRAGTYQYWATLAEWQRKVPLPPQARQHGLLRPRFDSQLAGALIVDSGGPVPDDRIFVITQTVDQVPPIRFHPGGAPERDFTAINGRSWPYTERLHYAVGDTVHWRIINAAVQSHPMHLHGFYFRVESEGGAETGRDSTYAPADRRMVVTEGMRFGATRTLTWSPDRPGGWLFHCHLISHTTLVPRIDRPDDMAYPGEHDHGDPDRHALTGMNGLVLGITVSGSPPPHAAWRPNRRLRLFVQSDSTPGDSTRRFGYVLQRGAEPARDSVESPGPLLLLVRGEPTSIAVTNRTSEPTTVHWHGIELESYYDGVAGWSGEAAATAPAIRPDSGFEVHITPRRAGTFMYHTHFNEMRQHYLGLVGPLVVLEPGQRWDPARELLFTISDGASGTLLMDGSAAPPPRELHVGTTYRIRIMDIAIYQNNLIARIVRDSLPLTWRAVAKDGFTLPPGRTTTRPSSARVSSGETADFEFTPDTPGDLKLEIGTPPLSGGFKQKGVMQLRVVKP